MAFPIQFEENQIHFNNARRNLTAQEIEKYFENLLGLQEKD